MNPWVRLLLATAAVIAAALLLKVLPAFVVLALLVVGLALLTRGLKRESRREATGGAAAILGLQRATEDPFGLRALPLSLFGRTPDGSFGELLSGSWRGADVRVFEYAFGSGLPGEPPVRRVFSCAVAVIGASVPATVVEPSAFMTMFPRPPELDRLDPDEGGRFWTVFDVWAADAHAARQLLDERMTDWLLGLDEGWGFEIHERAAAVFGPRPSGSDPAAPLGALAGFLDRLPDELRSLDGGADEPSSPVPRDPTPDG
ncbi:MAG TPA: hypothetical protein VE669_08750 [Actinomycetota bacterium]|jgi:hypothetical protein|nr:hypothetical protein [Actinomycetota bacterium]